MACLLALILAATVLTVPTGNTKLLANAARTSPAEAFWRTALPGAPMPEAIRELLHPHADDKATVLNDDVKLKDDGDDPPPMNFNYDDYRAAPSRRRNGKLDDSSAQNGAATSPTVFFLEDAVGAVPFRCVRAALEGGSSFVVCHRREAGGPDDAAVTYVCRGAKTSGPARAYAAGGRGNGESPVSP